MSETQAVMAAMCHQMGLSEPVYVAGGQCSWMGRTGRASKQLMRTRPRCQLLTAWLSPPHMHADLRTDLASLYADRVADASTLHSVLTTKAAYAGIYHPMRPAPGGGFVPDFSTRLLSEDVPCGLVAVHGIAEVLGVATPRMDAVITWAQEKLGKEYLVGGHLLGRHVSESGAPQRFGASRPEELVITAAVPEEDGQAYVAACSAVGPPCSRMSRAVSCPVRVHCR